VNKKAKTPKLIFKVFATSVIAEKPNIGLEIAQSPAELWRGFRSLPPRLVSSS
jgi:hypothetical protein